MDRTAEQDAAEVVLREAVKAVVLAYGDSGYGLLTDFVVIYVLQDGSDTTAVGMHVPPGQPLYRSIGLLEFSRARSHGHVMED